MPSAIHRSPLRSNPGEYNKHEPMNFTNMNNPSGVRAIPTREEADGQPSAYKSLREKSPTRQSSPTRGGDEDVMMASAMHPSGGHGNASTTFATVSIIILLSHLFLSRAWLDRAYSTSRSDSGRCAERKMRWTAVFSCSTALSSDDYHFSLIRTHSLIYQN